VAIVVAVTIWRTDIFDDIAQIEELHRPKIGIVPIDDRLYHERRSGCTRLPPL
jgi:hypothetical protein